MRTATFSTDMVAALLRERAVDILTEIILAFGTASRRAVCRKLVCSGRLERQKLDGRLLDCSPSRQEQLRSRKVVLAGETTASPATASCAEPIQRATAKLVSVLDERQRRLYAGL